MSRSICAMRILYAFAFGDMGGSVRSDKVSNADNLSPIA